MSDMDISTIDCENEHSTSLSDVPIEILEKIQTYLESIDIVRLRGVSKQIQENLDSLDQTESLLYSEINSVVYLKIEKNNIHISNKEIPRYMSDPVKYPPESLAVFPITGIRQLNWYRPMWLTYAYSTILESSLDLEDFLEDVQDLAIVNILHSTDPIVRKKRLKNFCANLRKMINLSSFHCGDENLTFEELEKIIKSFRLVPSDVMIDSDMIYITFNGNIPFYKKSILSLILAKTKMALLVRVGTNSDIERDFDEEDYEGIEWFMKIQSPDPEKRLELSLGTCPESICDKLIELSHKWFGHGETEPGIIEHGQNTLTFER
ncbi:unnamed protein product [Caenorhabditis angaria]|uniref:F-box domain-containing protein n=1 Tax=Caenorhabditis angaria TaxID=860376 RepID=A0A9P1J1S4_9PELO|nr:unnamed protein product [Caenorhabditis angaria]